MARYNPNGSLDTSFGTGGFVSGPFGVNSTASAAALYPSGTPNAGEIVVAGQVGDQAGTSHVALARYTANGALDATFGTGGQVVGTTPGTGGATSVALAADGKLVVAGNWNGSDFALGRYNPDGSLDSTFGTGGSVTLNLARATFANAVALQSNGDIVVAGDLTDGTKYNILVARFLASAPEVGSFTASPNAVPSGSSTTLTASNISDANPGATVTQVSFYLDSSGDGKLEPGTDTLLGTGTPASPGVWTLNYTATLAPGSYTLFAQAQDSDGVLGDPLALTLQVS
jgi:uncharacterized delta-60 repeat protein